MPELPEAETIARGLRGPLTGSTVLRVKVLHSDLLDETSEEFSERLQGTRIVSVDRRGKNLVLKLESGAPDGVALDESGLRTSFLIVNLGMSGRLLYRPLDATAEPPSHPAVRLHLEGGGQLVYHDVRRFGRLRVLEVDDYTSWSRALGPEPLSPRFRARDLLDTLRSSRSPARSLLLDQKRVAGVGNIYANEALFRAGIDPRRPANGIGEIEARRLHRSLRTVLREAVQAGGTTLRDYRTAQGWRGTYSDRLQVYGREGSPCHACGHAIERIVFGGRSAFLCPNCQPREGGRT
ncbi:MAG: bifunctional DNA-formamidopyrimidine glycosylase/DNA-(apurinic or apyrimidinic site) lyase [Gemmatimonadota bacterium]